MQDLLWAKGWKVASGGILPPLCSTQAQKGQEENAGHDAHGNQGGQQARQGRAGGRRRSARAAKHGTPTVRHAGGLAELPKLSEGGNELGDWSMREKAW